MEVLMNYFVKVMVPGIKEDLRGEKGVRFSAKNTFVNCTTKWNENRSEGVLTPKIKGLPFETYWISIKVDPGRETVILLQKGEKMKPYIPEKSSGINLYSAPRVTMIRFVREKIELREMWIETRAEEKAVLKKKILFRDRLPLTESREAVALALGREELEKLIPEILAGYEVEKSRLERTNKEKKENEERAKENLLQLGEKWPEFRVVVPVPILSDLIPRTASDCHPTSVVEINSRGTKKGFFSRLLHLDKSRVC
jgi:hypothetical protein